MSTFKMPSSTSLIQLPKNLLFSVLYKTAPNKELCRLRRTCSTIDSFVEKHQQKFASRDCRLGVEIRVDDESEEVKWKLVSHEEPVFTFDEAKTPKSFSGISISILQILGSTIGNINGDNNLGRALNLIRPTCNLVYFGNLPADYVMDFAENVNIVEGIVACFREQDEESLKKIEKFTHLRQVLVLDGKLLNDLLWRINLYGHRTNRGYFIHYNIHEFDEQYPFTSPNLTPPDNVVLWDRSRLAKGREERVYCPLDTPKVLRKVPCGDICIIVHERAPFPNRERVWKIARISIDLLQRLVELEVIDNDQEKILKEVQKLLEVKIDRELWKDEAKQADVIRKAFVAQRMPERYRRSPIPEVPHKMANV